MLYRATVCVLAALTLTVGFPLALLALIASPRADYRKGA